MPAAPIMGTYFKGFQEAWRYLPLVGIYYLFNLITAVLLTWPVINFLSIFLADGNAGASLFEQYNLTLLIQLLYQHIAQLPLFPILTGYLFLFLCGAILLRGGTLYILIRPAPFQLIQFIWGGIVYYLRFLYFFLLMVIAVFFLLIVNTILALILPAVFGSWVLPVMMIFMVMQCGILFMFFDYTCIITVLNDIGKIRSALKRAVAFVFKNGLKVSGLYLLYWLPLILILTVHLILPDLSRMGVIPAFIYGQLVMIIQSYLRVSLLAGQIAYLISIKSNNELAWKQ